MIAATDGVVIVGTGVAGITAAETLRAQGYTGTVTVIGDEPAPPYRRTALSKDIVTADLSIGRIRLRAAEFWRDREIEIIADMAVTAIDPERRRIRLASGADLGYRALLLATGARPHRSKAAPEASSLRRHSEAVALQRAMSALADGGGTVVIAGAGLIGLELAASARGRGIEVTVADAAARPMVRMPELVGDYFADLHRRRGVRLLLSTTIESATRTPTGSRVRFSDGTDAAADVVIAAIGVRSETSLAEGAGMAAGPAGIEVDEHQRTSVAGVYAAGDVAAVVDPMGGRVRVEHWLSAQEQGKAAGVAIAADLAGATPEPTSLIPHAWTSQYGINVQFVGWPALGDSVSVDGDLAASDATVRYLRDGETIGAVAIGRPAVARTIKADLHRIPVR